jgi:hypothetical protein
MFKKLLLFSCILSSCTTVDTTPEISEYPTDDLMIQTRVNAYESGYFACLQDLDNDLYLAYLHGRHAVMYVEEQEKIDSIVFELASRYNLDDERREHLYTLITD